MAIFNSLPVDTCSYLTDNLHYYAPLDKSVLTSSFYWLLQKTLQKRTGDSPFTFFMILDPAYMRERRTGCCESGFDPNGPEWSHSVNGTPGCCGGGAMSGTATCGRRECVKVQVIGAVNEAAQPAELPLVFTRGIGGEPKEWREGSRLIESMSGAELDVIVNSLVSPVIETPTMEVDD